MSDDRQESRNDEVSRSLLGLLIVGFSLLPIVWAAYSAFVVGTNVGAVLFPLLFGVGHLILGIYMYLTDSSDATEKVEQELDDDFEL